MPIFPPILLLAHSLEFVGSHHKLALHIHIGDEYYFHFTAGVPIKNHKSS